MLNISQQEVKKTNDLCLYTIRLYWVKYSPVGLLLHLSSVKDKRPENAYWVFAAAWSVPQGAAVTISWPAGSFNTWWHPPEEAHEHRNVFAIFWAPATSVLGQLEEPLMGGRNCGIHKTSTFSKPERAHTDQRSCSEGGPSNPAKPGGYTSDQSRLLTTGAGKTDWSYEFKNCCGGHTQKHTHNIP